MTLLNTTEDQINIAWRQVASASVTHYKVRAVPLKSHAPTLSEPFEWKYTEAAKQAELLGLTAGTLYNISVWAETTGNASDATSIMAWTEVGEPDPPPQAEIVSRNGPTMEIQLHPGTSSKGPITGYRVVVYEKDSLMAFSEHRLKQYETAMHDGTPFYLAAELSTEWSNRTFTLGDGQSYGGVFNAPLNLKDDYIPIQGVASSLNGITKYAYSQVGPALSADAEEQVMTGEEPGGKTDKRSALVFLLSVAIGVFGFLLLASLVAYVLLRRHYGRKKRRSEQMILQVQYPPETEENGFAPGALQLAEGADLGAFYAQLRGLFRQIPRPQLLVQDATLGQGQFGPVRVGVAHCGGEGMPVSVQRCPAQWMLPDRERRSLLSEIEGMVRLGVHPNVLEFVGGCEDLDVLHLVVEHPLTSLRGLLLTSRHGAEGCVCSFEETRLVDLAIGVAHGMQHLARRGVHHGQLSTRSVAVVDSFVPKITNFGLARYTPLGKKLNFARWLAPECVKSNHHTTKTDAWSFGVLLWEIFTLGGTPYVDIRTTEVAPRVARGLRLSKPRGVSDDLYQLMLQCWQTDADERPGFDGLAESLQELLTMEHPVKFTYVNGYTYERFDPLGDEM